MSSRTPSSPTLRKSGTRASRGAPWRHYAVAPVLGGVEQLQAEYIHHRFAPHGQETAVIGAVLHGEAVVHGAGHTLSLHAGDVLVIPPHILHDAHSLGTDTWQYRAVYLTTSQLLRLVGATEDGRGVLADRPFVISDAGLVEQIVAVQETLLACSESNEHDVLSQLSSLVSVVQGHSDRVLRPVAAERDSAAGITRVRRHIDDHPFERLSLADMAQIAGLSRFTFAHSFSRAYGVSPHAYALQRKVAAARSLLVEGEQVSRAAHRVGFADQAHLTRRFLSVFGVTPGEFQRAWRG